MPCYTQRQTTVDLAAADRALLVRALRQGGWQVSEHTDGTLVLGRGGRSGTIRDGQITVGEDDLGWVNEIKRAYARTALDDAALRFGWQARQSAPDNYRLTRRFG